MSNDQNSSANSLSNGQPTKDEPDTEIETIVIDPDSTIVELTACRLRNIEGLEGLTKVEILNMRQNLIKNIENLSQLTTLKQIDLYDNLIERIEGLDSLIQLKHLDLSFSMLTKS
jgi:protein phosphatase 1 regulatory subunit 7